MKILSKILTFFLILASALLFLSSPISTHAASQTTPAQTSVKTPLPNTNADVPNNLHNYTQNVMIEVMSSLVCQIAGVDPVNPKQSCLSADQKTGKIGFLPSPQEGGAIGTMGNMITMLYTPPLHTADYFQNLAHNFGIAKTAFAQQPGSGFQGLSPLINIWVAFRNIAYVIFILVFVIIGLAIMLRIKIDPRTVMTIQNSIPKIIIGIILVTFSFAIAGFMVDMMYVLIYFSYGIISGIPGINVQNLNPAVIQGKDAISAAGGMGGISSIAGDVTSGLKPILQDFIGVSRCNSVLNCGDALFNPLNFIGLPSSGGISFQPFELIYDLISWTAGSAMFFKIVTIPAAGGGTPVFSDLVKFIVDLSKSAGALAAAGAVGAGTQYILREALPQIIIYLIIFIALLAALFRLWFNLLLSYIFILLHTVLAPFWIIASLLPGSSISFTGWLRDFAANIIAFPATILMFLIGKAFMDAFQNVSNPFVPPLVGNIADMHGLSSLIGLGIILSTPGIINVLKQALKAPKIDISGVMQSLSAGTGTLGGTTKQTAGAISSYMIGDPYTKEKGWKAVVGGFTRKHFG